MMKRVELSEKMTTKVNGGMSTTTTVPCAAEADDYYNEIHPGCGGHIEGHYQFWRNCKCQKCGFERYSYDNFFHMERVVVRGI